MSAFKLPYNQAFFEKIKIIIRASTKQFFLAQSMASSRQ